MPSRRGAWAIYEVFQTADDGELFIGVTSDQQWERFVEEFSLREMAANSRLATNVMRLSERVWLIPALQNVLATIPQAEVEARCERANVSWARVGQPGDLFTDPHLLATGGLLDVFISRVGGTEGKKVSCRPYQSNSARAATGRQSEDRHHGLASTLRKSSPRRRFPAAEITRFSKAARSSVAGR